MGDVAAAAAVAVGDAGVADEVGAAVAAVGVAAAGVTGPSEG